MRDVVLDVRVEESDGQIRAEDFPELTVDPIRALGIEADIRRLVEEPDDLRVMVAKRRALAKPVAREDPEPMSGCEVERRIELSGPHAPVFETGVQDLHVHSDPHLAELVLNVYGRSRPQS